MSTDDLDTSLRGLLADATGIAELVSAATEASQTAHRRLGESRARQDPAVASEIADGPDAVAHLASAARELRAAGRAVAAWRADAERRLVGQGHEVPTGTALERLDGKLAVLARHIACHRLGGVREVADGVYFEVVLRGDTAASLLADAVAWASTLGEPVSIRLGASDAFHVWVTGVLPGGVEVHVRGLVTGAPEHLLTAARECDHFEGVSLERLRVLAAATPAQAGEGVAT